MVPIKTWSHKPHAGPVDNGLRSIGREQVVDSTFWRARIYITRCTDVRSRSETSGDIVCLAIVLSVAPSLESAHFRKGSLFYAARLICAAQPEFSATAQHMYYKHFCKAKSWPVCCISRAPAPSTITLLHGKWLKRTHKLLRTKTRNQWV